MVNNFSTDVFWEQRCERNYTDNILVYCFNSQWQQRVLLYKTDGPFLNRQEASRSWQHRRRNKPDDSQCRADRASETKCAWRTLFSLCLSHSLSVYLLFPRLSFMVNIFLIFRIYAWWKYETCPITDGLFVRRANENFVASEMIHGQGETQFLSLLGQKARQLGMEICCCCCA